MTDDKDKLLPRVSQTLETCARNIRSLETELYAYKEYYEADRETSAAYDMVSPGLNTPLNPVCRRAYESKMAAAVRRMENARYLINRIQAEKDNGNDGQ